MGVVTEWIDDVARFEALGEEWDRLATLDPSPFSRHAWLLPWWHAFGEGAELRVCAGRDGGELVAALPLLRRGRALAAMANEHSPSFRPLARDAAALEALAAALVAERRPVELRSLPAREEAVPGLTTGVEAGGARVLTERGFVSPLTETTGTFEDYRARMKSGWREIERRGRKMDREHEVQRGLVAEPAELDRELEEGLALEAAGWKGESGTAIVRDESTARFYGDMARAFHEAGELRLSSLRVDGRLAAFDLALVHAGRYYLLKTAYDEQMRTLAPGLVLRRAVIERCFELGLEAHEFLGADMEWKRLFSTGDREHLVWRAYPGGPLTALDFAYRRILRPGLKRAYRTVRPRRRSRAAS